MHHGHSFTRARRLGANPQGEPQRRRGFALDKIRAAHRANKQMRQNGETPTKQSEQDIKRLEESLSLISEIKETMDDIKADTSSIKAGTSSIKADTSSIQDTVQFNGKVLTDTNKNTRLGLDATFDVVKVVRDNSEKLTRVLRKLEEQRK
jgi:K+/H+ antiporter YhaU regulatory subunit KhtT